MTTHGQRSLSTGRPVANASTLARRKRGCPSTRGAGASAKRPWRMRPSNCLRRRSEAIGRPQVPAPREHRPTPRRSLGDIPLARQGTCAPRPHDFKRINGHAAADPAKHSNFPQQLFTRLNASGKGRGPVIGSVREEQRLQSWVKHGFYCTQWHRRQCNAVIEATLAHCRRKQ